MAVLRLQNGTTYTEESEIVSHLAKIQFNRWPVGDSPQLQSKLAKPSLSEEEKTQVLTELDGYFQQLQQTESYQSRDLVVLHPEVPNLDAILSKFDRIHCRYGGDGTLVLSYPPAAATLLHWHRRWGAPVYWKGNKNASSSDGIDIPVALW